MAIADASTPWALRVTALSERLAADMNRPEHLVDLAERVQQVARDQSCTALVGASEAGRRIVEAASKLNGHSAMGIADANVLIVDGLLATGNNLVAAAELVRKQGAKAISVVAALADATAVRAVERELGATVIVLELTE